MTMITTETSLLSAYYVPGPMVMVPHILPYLAVIATLTTHVALLYPYHR